MIKNDRTRKMYEKRISQGLCVTCGKPNDTDTQQCSECREKSAIKAKERREFLKSYGFCPRCGINKIFGPENTCPECRAKEAERALRYREENKVKVRIRDIKIQKSRRIRLLSNGICPICGKRQVTQGYKSCVYCRKKAASKKRERNSIKPTNIHKIWKEQGLCYYCGKEREPGYRVCHECHIKGIEYARRSKESHERNLEKELMNNG